MVSEAKELKLEHNADTVDIEFGLILDFWTYLQFSAFLEHLPMDMNELLV